VEAAPAPANRVAVGRVINETFSIYGQNAVALLGSSIVVFVIVGVASGLLQSAGGVVLGLLGALIQLAAFALYAGFVVKLVQDVRDGRRDETVGDLVSSAAPAILPLIAFGILFGIGVAIGLVLLIVPGLILLTFWSVVAPVTVIERPGVFSAFGRSWELVRGYAWPVFGTIVLVFLLVIAASIAAALIGLALGDVGRAILSWIFDALTQPVVALTASVLYYTLLQVRGSGQTPQV
jgi:hypothetical protein